MHRNKWITYRLPIMCFVFVLLFGAARVYAASAYGFETDDLSAEEKQTIWQNINVQRISEFQNLTDFSVPEGEHHCRLKRAGADSELLGIQRRRCVICEVERDTYSSIDGTGQSDC